MWRRYRLKSLDTRGQLHKDGGGVCCYCGAAVLLTMPVGHPQSMVQIAPGAIAHGVCWWAYGWNSYE